MKTLHEKAQAYFDGLKTVFIDVIGVEKSSQLQQLKVLELFTPNAFMAGYETHLHETRWRSVEEELPLDCTDVLVKCVDEEYDDTVPYYESDSFVNGKFINFHIEATHWKPIV